MDGRKGRTTAKSSRPFPSEVARLIGMFSFVGDTVLDPFWGLGNTTIAAMDMHRSSIGFEIEPAYVATTQRAVAAVPTDSTVEFMTPDRIRNASRRSHPMPPAPDAFIRHLTVGYHPRSDKHSNVLAAIVDDLARFCPKIAERSRAGEIVYDLNFQLRAGTADWNVDLVLGTPAVGAPAACSK